MVGRGQCIFHLNLYEDTLTERKMRVVGPNNMVSPCGTNVNVNKSVSSETVL